MEDFKFRGHIYIMIHDNIGHLAENISYGNVVISKVKSKEKG